MTVTTHGPGRVRSDDELKTLVEQASAQLSEATARELVSWAGEVFGSRLAVACSMAADTVLPHLVSQAVPGVDVLFLDTGYHFAETYGTRDALAEVIQARIVNVTPRQSVAEQDAEHGPRLHDVDPGRCCHLRKVDPIDAELTGYEAWVTGIRREDNALRADAALIEWDARHQMVKINPIAAWSFDDVVDYAHTNGVPINVLLTAGYPSIGCEPCTRAVSPEEDPRAGRWAGLAKTECGLHL
ncbi:MAG: phosphoadenylyl-sulfate reductase [Candidatus Phosphoribacter sp.]